MADQSPSAGEETAPTAPTPPTSSSPAPTPTPTEPASGGPFQGEEEVMHEGVATRDDISATQAAPAATRDVSASHIARLLYHPIEAPGGPVYQSQVLERRTRPQ